MVSSWDNWNDKDQALTCPNVVTVQPIAWYGMYCKVVLQSKAAK